MKFAFLACSWLLGNQPVFGVQPPNTTGTVTRHIHPTEHVVNGSLSLKHFQNRQPGPAKQLRRASKTLSSGADRAWATVLARLVNPAQDDVETAGGESESSKGQENITGWGALSTREECNAPNETYMNFGTAGMLLYWLTPIILVGTAGFTWGAVSSMEYRRDMQVERSMFKHFSEKVGEKGTVSHGSSSDAGNTMFGYLSLTPDGGISKISDLEPLDTSRVAYALLALGFILFNIGYVISEDVEIVGGYADYYLYNSTCSFSSRMQSYLHMVEHRKLITLEVWVLVANLELMGLVLLCTLVLRALVVFLSTREAEAQFDAFFHVWIAFDFLNELQSYSLLRTIQFAHPCLLSQQLREQIAHPFLGESKYACHLQIAYFVISRVATILMALAAFGMKMALTSVYLYGPEGKDDHKSWFNYAYAWGMLAVFFMQALCALPLEHVLRDHLFLFISGGDDASMDLAEHRMHRTYLAMITQEVHQMYTVEGRYFSAFVLLLTLSHEDMQHLLVSEDSDSKSESLSRFRASVHIQN